MARSLTQRRQEAECERVDAYEASLREAEVQRVEEAYADTIEASA